MSQITAMTAREILDSRGQPTIEVDVMTSKGNLGRAAVPSGASTGAHEACELRDQDNKRFQGKGVLTAVKNVKEILAPKLIGMKVADQELIDKTILALDGTKNKTKLGANALLGVSLACAKAAALDAGVSLFKLLGGDKAQKLPVPLMNVLNGGAHANNGLDIQEFMIVPMINHSYSDSLRAGSEIFQALKKILNKKSFSTAVGDEGGFAPKLANNEQALELLMEAIAAAGYQAGTDVYVALDVAATELFKDGRYTWEGKTITSAELTAIYEKWCSKYPMISIEDGMSEDDWEGWKHLTKTLGRKIQLVGDDLFVTNPERLQKGIDDGCANALLVKVNQIGTLSETKAAVALAQKSNYATVMSHRSGETEDATIADLAVGLSCQQIKTGSACRGERTAKYNQLLRIQEELSGRAQYWDRTAFGR